MNLLNITTDLVSKIVDFVFEILPAREVSSNSIINCKVIGHRGAMIEGIKENSKEAFEFAISQKADGIELDVRWTRDLVPVISHDANLLRVFGASVVLAETNFAQVKELCSEILSLEEVIGQFGHKVHLMIELKDEPYPNIEKQKTILKQILSRLESEKDYHFISLSPGPLIAFDFVPKSAAILVAEFNVESFANQVLTDGWGGLFCHYLLLKSDTVRILKDNHKLVGTGFVRSKKVLSREVARGMDWIFTNRPDKVRQIKNHIKL